MKKILVLVMALMMLVGIASASEVDLSGMSDEELVALSQRICTEIFERKIEKTAHLSAGEYTGGKEIPAGDYILFVDNREGDAPIKLDFITKTYDDLHGFVAVGEATRVMIKVYEDDRLIVHDDFDLTIHLQGVVNFE